MFCENCKHEVYRYRRYFIKGELVSKCFDCSYDNFPGRNTNKILMDWKENLYMSPASYYEATHTVLGPGGIPFVDRQGKYLEKCTLTSKLKERIK